jgi:hypothetical protein
MMMHGHANVKFFENVVMKLLSAKQMGQQEFKFDGGW